MPQEVIVSGRKASGWNSQKFLVFVWGVFSEIRDLHLNDKGIVTTHILVGVLVVCLITVVEAGGLT